MRLMLERFEPDVFERKTAENRRPVHSLVARLVNARFKSERVAFFCGQFFKFFPAERNRVNFDKFDSVGVIHL